ncbi:tryptophan synthase subunit alpha [Lachnobacterium bovis]|uniref:Tryptophan synthase alpha chain n=1 Tax=Lachnobacterium bovis TaxID=140626 RepID=A0A1H9TWI0_9FIRM|nr:tryptophan synthase subunit alpha [Lachnobacterium bovis]SES01486.1 tryptophan synthase, alpha chain [Lachnobacterium bovis]
MNNMESIITNKIGKNESKNRIEKCFENLKNENKKAFITYVTAGYPDYETTKQILFSQEKAGVDLIELGIPFSDPIADGPVIQKASFDAIQKGANLIKTFECLKEVRKQGLKIPVIFMLYYNTIYFCGLEKFVKMCVDAGVDGVIVPDLPFEEQDELQNEIDKYAKNKIFIIQLVSPISKNRMDMILNNAKGFVYCVSSMGVTGQNADFYNEVEDYLETVKNKTSIPIALGFGIRKYDDVEKIIDKVDGVIVGTRLIEVLMENDFSVSEAYEYSKKFKDTLEMKIK